MTDDRKRDQQRGPVHEAGMFNVDMHYHGAWHGGRNRKTQERAIRYAEQLLSEGAADRVRVVDPNGNTVWEREWHVGAGSEDVQTPAEKAREEHLAREDARITGVGFLVDGKRVAPDRVTVVVDGKRVSASRALAAAGWTEQKPEQEATDGQE
jgi:hypothetical protein